jgi:hypothetical protein
VVDEGAADGGVDGRGVTGEELAAILHSLLEPRRAALKPARLMLVVVEDGPFYVDTQATPIAGPGWRDDPAVTVLTNRKTARDLLLGELDPAKPTDGQLFMWSGDGAAFAVLADALEGGKSALSTRIDAMKRK